MINKDELPIQKRYSSLYQLSQEEKENVDENLDNLENHEDQDNQSIHSMQEIYPQLYPHYHGEEQWFVSRLWFWHFFKYSQTLKNQVIVNHQQVQRQHLPKLSVNEDIKYNFVSTDQQVSLIDSITWRKLFIILFFGRQKWNVIMIISTFLIQSIVKNSMSIVIKSVIQSMGKENLSKAYGFGALLIFLNLVNLFSYHHAQSNAGKFSSLTRMTLISLVYNKSIELSPASLKSKNVGRILNLVSGDINSLSVLLVTFFKTLVIPITLMFASATLWGRYGPIGLVAIVICFMNYGIQVLLQYKITSIQKIVRKNVDKRLKMTNELILGIRQIKLYTWDDLFKETIFDIRKFEMNQYFLYQMISLFERLINSTSQFWSSLAFFSIQYYYGYEQDLDVADMIATYQLLQFIKNSCVLLMSQGIQSILVIKMCLQRIVTILNIQNVEMDCLLNYDTCRELTDYSISIRNLTVQTQDEQIILNSVNLNINYGELWAIVGKIGCGKSALFNSILKQFAYSQGSIKFGNQYKLLDTPLKISYVEQEPFIFQGSVRTNILFGRPYDKKLYDTVLQATCLDHDLVKMKFYDFTEIGEKGTTLSGGQKVRLSLARALYQLADIYLLDDPLSAVDANYVQNIFYKAIKEFIFEYQPTLQPKRVKPSVLLVTHQIQYAIECHKIAIMAKGTIIASGTYEEIKDSLYMADEELAKQLELDNQIEEEKRHLIQPKIMRRYRLKRAITNNLIGNDGDTYEQHNYLRYFKFWNIYLVIIIIILNIIAEILLNWYIYLISNFDSIHQEKKQIFLMFLYILIGYLATILIKYILNIVIIHNIQVKLHNRMINSIVQAPTEYFDQNPSGRIINRFSNDLQLTDTQSYTILIEIQDSIFNFIIALVALAIIQPYFAFLTIFIIATDTYLYFYSKTIISQLKEVELSEKSPLYAFLIQTIDGALQIQLYRQSKWFKEHFMLLANNCNKSTLTYNYASRSLAFHIDVFGFIVQVIGLFIIIHLDQSDLAHSVLLLSIFNVSLNQGIRLMILFDNQFNSFDRIFQIIDIVSEAPTYLPGDNQIDFPSNGSIQFENVNMKYRSDSSLALNNLNFSINGGKKIAFVGKTGSGKSSIIQVLFRMTEVEQFEDTKLIIGNVDIRQIGLRKLRQNICIIPQSPFLYPGTIRKNLDPYNLFRDEQLWEALELVNLYKYIQLLPDQLLADLNENANIFSVGQKQLICIARAILLKKKIIVLDEATANVDMKTDEKIQDTLKSQFLCCTVITIAHRLNSIADYDKVLVMDNGSVIEQGIPYELLGMSRDSEQIDKDTHFAGMVRSTGQDNSQAIFEMAKFKYLENY